MVPSQRAVTSPAEEDHESPVGRPGGVVSPTNWRTPTGAPVPSVPAPAPITVRVPSALRTLTVPLGAVCCPLASESAAMATRAAAPLQSWSRSL